MPHKKTKTLMSRRFRGYLPIVIDVETAGLNPKRDALLEIAAVIIDMDEDGLVVPGKTYAFHVAPFEGANLDPEALKFNKIDPYHPFRFAVDERKALNDLFSAIHDVLKYYRCQRAVLVGHNAWFDLFFLKAAVDRCKLKDNPFHAFTSFDTASLAGITFGQTVLAKAMSAAGLPFDQSQAHSAIYDAERTAELFCKIVNLWQDKWEGMFGGGQKTD